jgi:hypothetical protein
VSCNVPVAEAISDEAVLPERVQEALGELRFAVPPAVVDCLPTANGSTPSRDSRAVRVRCDARSPTPGRRGCAEPRVSRRGCGATVAGDGIGWISVRTSVDEVLLG